MDEIFRLVLLGVFFALQKEFHLLSGKIVSYMKDTSKQRSKILLVNNKLEACKLLIVINTMFLDYNIVNHLSYKEFMT